MNDEILKRLVTFQKNEITEHEIYDILARREKSPENKEILKKISREELHHSQVWRSYTKRDVKPDRLKIFFYSALAFIFGITFGIKLMERGEDDASDNYAELKDVLPEAERIARDESEHESALIRLLDEERLRYTGSIVLGLNDALVELTGALAGFTLALQDTRLIALTGSITGIAAALSMGASEYLSTKAEDTDKNPLRASIYTGVAYIITVLILIMPYLLISNYFICLGLTLCAAILIIAFFTFYVSVVQDVPFRGRFLEMAALSLSVAAISFIIGFLMRRVIGIDL